MPSYRSGLQNTAGSDSWVVIVRIDTLSYSNMQTQGAQRREWLRVHAPQHLEHCMALILHALHQRQEGASQGTLILGAGACTEVPLTEVARASDEVILADLDLASMQRALAELASPTLRRRVRLVQCDISGNVSARLAQQVASQYWQQELARGASAVFDAAAACLEQCVIPDPPELPTVERGSYGVVVSSLVLSQLFSYPLLDLLDHIQRLDPQLLGEQERHRRYQEVAQAFRIRIINAHLHLLRNLVDRGGTVTLLSDVRGFVFNVYGTDYDAAHRRNIPLVPRTFPALVSSVFTVVEEAHWEWITDLPDQQRPGRGYEVTGYVLKPMN
jgi:hypothetical protein